MANLEEWDEAEGPSEDITVEELDELAELYAKCRAQYEEASSVAKDLHASMAVAQINLVRALQATKKPRYFVDGLGGFNLKTTYSVRCPKDLDDKKKLLQYIRTKGDEVYLGLVSVNSRTLNSFYNQEQSSAEERGDAGFILPGVEAPTAQVTIQFKKEKKKGN